MGRPTSASVERTPGISSKLFQPGTSQQRNEGPSGDMSMGGGIWLGPTRTRPISAPVYSSQWADTNTVTINTTYLDAREVLGAVVQEPFVAVPQRKSRPKSASVTAAAWKAYGSPKLRGQVRAYSPPSPIHPKAMQQGTDPLNSRPPSVGMLGGGFHYPPAGSQAALRAAAPAQQQASGRGGPGKLHSIPEFHGRMISDPPVPEVPELLMPFQPRTADALMSAHQQEKPQDADEYRFCPTHPTDPFAQRTWAGILAKHDSTHHASHTTRPHSACAATPSHSGRHHSTQPPVQPSRTVHRSRPCSARARFSSMSVGSIAHLGTSYSPPAVTGASQPLAEFPLPDTHDSRWSNSRLGASAMQRLAVGLKLPMSAATHTGTASRPNSPMHRVQQSPPQETVQRVHGPAVSLLAQQQEEVRALLAAEAARSLQTRQSQESGRQLETRASVGSEGRLQTRQSAAWQFGEDEEGEAVMQGLVAIQQQPAEPWPAQPPPQQPQLEPEAQELQPPESARFAAQHQQEPPSTLPPQHRAEAQESTLYHHQQEQQPPQDMSAEHTVLQQRQSAEQSPAQQGLQQGLEEPAGVPLRQSAESPAPDPEDAPHPQQSQQGALQPQPDAPQQEPPAESPHPTDPPGTPPAAPEGTGAEIAAAVTGEGMPPVPPPRKAEDLLSSSRPGGWSGSRRASHAGSSVQQQVLDSTVEAVDRMLMRALSRSHRQSQSSMAAPAGEAGEGAAAGVRAGSARPMTALQRTTSARRASSSMHAPMLSVHAQIEEAASEEDEDMMVD